MGARAAYSSLNGVVITCLCLVGGVTLVLQVVPLEVTLGILLWIGIIITAQAFQEVPKSHALAVAVGLIPSLAVWALQILIEPSLRVGGQSLHAARQALLEQGGLYLDGVIALGQGFLLSAMVLSAILVFIIERQFLKAAAWTAAAAVLSLVGLIHAYELTPAGVQNTFLRLELAPNIRLLIAAPEFTIVYGLTALLLVLLHWVEDTQTRR
jgi:AGZA family xanthine/uracil permease-like MFS transporter